MGNQRDRKRKADRTRNSAAHNEYQRLKYHEKKKQKSTNIEEIRNEDANRDLDHNVDDINLQNQIREQEIEPGMYKYCKFV